MISLQFCLGGVYSISLVSSSIMSWPLRQHDTFSILCGLFFVWFLSLLFLTWMLLISLGIRDTIMASFSIFIDFYCVIRWNKTNHELYVFFVTISICYFTPGVLIVTVVKFPYHSNTNFKENLHTSTLIIFTLITKLMSGYFQKFQNNWSQFIFIFLFLVDVSYIKLLW